MTAESTPNLDLPYIMPSQAQKHVTHNEALRMLDALTQIRVESRTLATPPTTPADGVRYIVPAGAFGAWTGQAGKIAAWQDGAWTFFAAGEGWLCWVDDEDLLVACGDSGWAPAVPLNPTARIGVNATADDTNRLSVSAAATLLSHAGTSHRLKINKQASGDTASLLFQTNWSGRAEFGLTGSDDFKVKVSADGSAWTDAISINRTSGAVSFPASGPATVVKAADNVAWTGTHSWSEPIASLKIGSGTAPSMPSVPLNVYGSVGGVDGVFQVYNTLSATWVGAFQAYAPNLAAGQEIYCTVGKNSAAYNRMGFGMHYVASASTSNYLYLGFTGADYLLTIQAGGNAGIGTTSPTARLDVRGTLRIGSFTVAGLPSASTSGAGTLAYVSNASGGPTLACSDGANWRVVAALGATVT